MEAELNSPQVRLAPGESYAFDTDWFPTRCGKEFAGVSDAGVVIRALRASRAEGRGIQLAGSFGVFFFGRLVAHVYDRGGRLLSSVPLSVVDPLHVVDIEQSIGAPAESARVSVHVEDSTGTDRGSLGEAVVQPAEKAP